MSIWSICCLLAIIWFSKLLFFSGADTFGEDIREIFFVLVIGVFIVLVGLSDFTLQYLRKVHGVIEREWRLLDALSEDFQEAKRSVEQIDGKAKQVWESEALKLRGMTQKLSEGEARWVKETGELLFEVRRCTKEFEKGSERRGILAFLKPILTLDGPPTEVELAFAMRRAKRAIRKYWESPEKKCAKDSVRLLEASRCQLRRVQDRPIEDSKIDPPEQPLHSEVSSVLESLIIKKPDMALRTKAQIRSVVIQLNLLCALMADLQGVKLESQIEYAWLDGAHIIVEQAHMDIGVLLQEEAANQNQRLSSVLDYWRFRPKLKKVMDRIEEQLAHLLETKKRYSFKFVIRSSAKDVTLNPRHCEDNGASGAISSILRDFQRKQQERELKGEKTPRDFALLGELQKLEKRLKDQGETKGAIERRKACFSLLQKLFSDLYGGVGHPQLDQIDQITRDVKLLQRCFKQYRIKEVLVDESCSVVGLKEDIHKLVLNLTSSDGPRVISIVGMRGIGKTTLAKEICNHKYIANHFDACHLVPIPETEDPIVLLQTVANKILKTNETRSESEYWIDKLKDLFLKEQKFLVVLDGIFSTDTWDNLKPAVIPDGSMSRIMLTTRDKEVASHVNLGHIHHHRLRTTEESWELFTQMVTISDPKHIQGVENKFIYNKQRKQAEKLAKKVIERTGGLPLTILRLGYLLSEKSVTKDELSVLLERISQGQNQSPWEDNLKNNRRDFLLKPAIETCLSYFQLFPKDFEIPSRRLVAVWVAQGITSTHTIESANELDLVKTEEQVDYYEYLLDLIDRNMVQPVKRKHNGKVLTCRFPSILKDIWSKGRSPSGTARSWSLYASSGKKVAYRFDHNEDGIDTRSIHSIHSNVLREENRPQYVTFLDSREGSGPGEDVCSLIVQAMKSGNFRGLLVLDLELVFKPILPDNIGALKKLKYLGLRWTSLEILPNSVGQLSELQTLDLKQTSLRSLPRSIWKLKKLQRLHLNQNFRVKYMPKPSEICMKNLHKLSGGFLDCEGKALLESLHKLSNLRKLRLSFELTAEEQEMLSKNIAKLEHLQSLSLRSVNISNESKDLKLMHLGTLKKLSSLYLLGRIDSKCNIVSELPSGLTELTLSASEFSQGPILLEMLAKLPELKYLFFLSRSYVDSKIVFVKNSFRKLLVLKLWALSGLVSLIVEKQAMPKIRELEIRGCKKLVVTEPDNSTGLTHLRTLHELKLTDMTREYVAIVEKEFAKAKRENLEESVHFPTIKIKYYDHKTQ